MSRRRLACSFAFVFLAAGCGGSVAAVPESDTGTPAADSGAADSTTPSDSTATPTDSGAADTTTVDDTGSGGPIVTDSGGTTVHEGGVACGTQTCTGGDVCCATASDAGAISYACAASCSGQSATIACTSPDNCGQNPCCTQLSGMSTTPGALCTTAPSDCVPQIDYAARSAQTRLCRNDADCISDAPSSQFRNCCTINYQGNTFKGCFNPMYASLAGQVGAQVTCP